MSTILTSLARNKHLPPEAVLELARYEHLVESCLIHRNAPDDLVFSHLPHIDLGTVASVAHYTRSPAVLSELAQHTSMEIRSNVAANTNTPCDVLMDLKLNPQNRMDVRLRAAFNRAIMPDAVLAAYSDNSFWAAKGFLQYCAVTDTYMIEYQNHLYAR